MSFRLKRSPEVNQVRNLGIKFLNKSNWKLQIDNCQLIWAFPKLRKGRAFAGLRFATVPMKDRYWTLTIPNANYRKK